MRVKSSMEAAARVTRRDVGLPTDLILKSMKLGSVIFKLGVRLATPGGGQFMIERGGDLVHTSVHTSTSIDVH